MGGGKAERRKGTELISSLTLLLTYSLKGRSFLPIITKDLNILFILQILAKWTDWHVNRPSDMPVGPPIYGISA
jgi:hypothetical protein